MKKETNSKDNGFELDDFWGFTDSNSQNTNNAEDDAWSFDDFFAAKEEKEEAELAEQRAAQERAAAREATRRQIEAEFAAKKKADEEAAAKLKEEELRKAEAETQAKLQTEAATKSVMDEAEAEKERVRQQAEEKARLSQARRKPVRMENTEEVPAQEEFSDTSTMSLNRLKPEIHLTAVEPLISDEPGSRTTEYDSEELEYEDEYEYEDGEYDDEYEYEDGEYDDEYEYEDGEYDDEYEYEDGEYDDEYEYEDGEYDDEYEYEDGEYDDDYDYEAEEEQQPEGEYVPVKQQEKKTSTGKYGSDEDWNALARDDEEEEKSKKPLIIGIVCGIVVLVLVAVIVWAFNRGDSEKEPVDMTSSVILQQKTLTGVITSIDSKNQTILVYDAGSGKEAGLNMKEVPHLMTGLVVGDIVDAEYEVTAGNMVSKLTKSQGITELNGVKNAVPNGSIIEIDGKTYYIDDKLICLYQDQAFDVKMISENTTYDAVAVNDHIYTITVTYATGTLKIENLSEYVNATIVLIPASDEPIEMLITGSLEPIDIQEGSVEIQIKNDKETLYTGKTFISAGKENTLKLPSIKDQKGKVVFSSNIDEEMTVLVNGEEHKGTDEVELAYGEYTGIFTAPGYQDVELKFTISQPYQQISVEFEENTTLVTISANLTGVSLYVDGVYQGELDGNSIGVRLAAGGHAVTCTKTGYYDQHQSIMILEGMEDQMLHFSGFEAIVESSTPVEESSAPAEESSAPVEESSTPSEESSTPTEESSTPVEESSEQVQESEDPVTEESVQESTDGEEAAE